MATTTFRNATASSSNVTSYAATSFTPAVGDLVVVFVVASGTVQNPSTMTSTGTGATAFSMIINTTFASGNTMYCFVSTTLAGAADGHVVTWDCTGDAATGCVITIFTVAGMTNTGSSAIRQTAVQPSVASGTPAPTFTLNTLFGNPTLSCVGNASSPAGMTPPTDWTLNASADTGYSTPTTGSSSVYLDSGFTGKTITWGAASPSAFGDIAIELNLANPANTWNNYMFVDSISAGVMSVTEKIR